MRKAWILLSLVFIAGPVLAGHRRYYSSASDLNVGTVPNNLLDPSSVTLRGTQWSMDVDVSTKARADSFNNFTATAGVSVTNLQIFRSTTDAQILALHGSTASIKSAFDAFTTTSDALQRTYNNFNSTGDALISNLLVWTTTATTRIDQHQVSLSTIASLLSNGALAVYSAGAAQGNATTINFTNAVSATCSGSTCTATVAAAAAASSIRSFTGIVVSTPGTPGADTTITSSQAFMLTLASFNAAGLTLSTTGFGTFYFTNGLYPIGGSTIPAGIAIVCESSVNFQTADSSGTMLTNYGTLGDPRGSPCNIDAGGMAFTGHMLDLKTNSVTNVNLIGGQNQATPGTGLTLWPGTRNFVNVDNSTNVRGSLWFKEFIMPGSIAVGSLGLVATMSIDKCRDVFFKIRSSSFTPIAPAATGNVFLDVAGSSNVAIEFDSEMAPEGWLNINRAPYGLTFSGYAGVNKYGASNPLGDLAVFGIHDNRTVGFSTGVIFQDLTINAHGNGSSHIFRIGANGGEAGEPNGVTINNVRIRCIDAGNAYVGVYIGQDSRVTTVEDTFITGCLNGITDNSSVGAKLRYFKDNALITQ